MNKLRQLIERAFRMGVMAGYYNNEITNIDDALTTTIPEMKRVASRLSAELDHAAAPELLAASEAIWQAATEQDVGDLDQFMAEGQGRLGVYLTPRELRRLKKALARARADSSD